MNSRSNGSASSRRAPVLARHAFRFLALLLVLGVPAGAAEAARKRVVVLDFKGPKARRVQRGVEKILKPTASVVTSKAFVRAARQVEGYAPDAAGVAKVAKSLQAHGIVTGKISRKGRKYSLTLQILEGRTGEVVGDGILVALKGGRLNSAARSKLRRELRAVLSDLPEPAGEEEIGPEEPNAGDDWIRAGDDPDANAGGKPAGSASGGKIAGSADDDTEAGAGEAPERTPLPPARRRPPRSRRVASADLRGPGGQSADQAEEGSVSRATAEQADRDSRGRAIDLAAGVSFASRKLTFNVADGVPELPQGYDGALVPGIYAAAELYPAALADRRGQSFVRDIGLSLVVDRVLLIKSELQEGGGESLPTEQTRFGGGLVYRWNFGSSPTNPTLKVSVRYNQLSFSIDETAADDPQLIELPDVSYTYIDPGLGLRLPIGSRAALLAEARYLYVLGTGQIQDQDRYGSASVVAFDADLAAEFKLTSFLVARAGGRYMNYSLDFDGDGELTERTGDGMQDVSSASDRYLGVYVTAGVLF